MSDQKLLACPHTSQRARVDEDAGGLWYAYYCSTCGETTCRSRERYPLFGVPYHRSEDGTAFWMGLPRKAYNE